MNKKNHSLAEMGEASYQKKFTVHSEDRKYLMRDYSNIITAQGVFVWDVKLQKIFNNKVIWTFVILIDNEAQYEKIKEQILALDKDIKIT